MCFLPLVKRLVDRRCLCSSDVNGGFGFATSDRNNRGEILTIIGDDVVLTCKAHEFTYSEHPEISFNKEPLRNSSGIIVINSRYTLVRP